MTPVHHISDCCPDACARRNNLLMQLILSTVKSSPSRPYVPRISSTKSKPNAAESKYIPTSVQNILS